jgi:hypothetical protein
MLKRYNEFSGEFLLESAINESVIYYSPALRSSLKAISRNDEIAIDLLNAEATDVKPDITFVDLDKEGYISFTTMRNALKIINDLGYNHLNIDKESSDRDRRKRLINDIHNHSSLSSVFTKSRNPLKIGKFVNKVIPGKFKDKDIEAFVNKFKANLENTGEIFQLVYGDDIAHWYNSENYQKEEGQLGNSCMRYKGPKTFEIYTKNPEVCKMLVLIENNQLIGRALVWKIESVKADQDLPGELYFMDRQYTIKESDVDKFRNYADEKGWAYKTNNNHGSLYNITYKGKSFKADMKVKLKEVGNSYYYDKYPYMDTFRRYDPTTGILVNDDSESVEYQGQYLLHDTSGGYSEIEGGVWSEWHDARIPENESVWSDWADSYIHRDRSTYVEHGSRRYHGWYPDDAEDIVYDEWSDISIHVDDSVYSSVYGYNILAENSIEAISDVDYDGDPDIDTDSFYHVDDNDLVYQEDYSNSQWYQVLSDRFSKWDDYKAAVGRLFDINYKGQHILKQFAIEEYKVLEPKDDSVDIAGIEYLTKLDAEILGYDIDENLVRKTDKFEYYKDIETLISFIYKRAEAIKEKTIDELKEITNDDDSGMKAEKAKKISYLDEKLDDINSGIFIDFDID